MTARDGTIDTGALFRDAHRGCWRADAPPLELSLREVTALMPLLIRTGSVGLIWPRLRHRAAEYGATGAGLEAAYQAQVAHNARVETEIARVVTHLRGYGIDPVLIKGWAVSRLYPEGLVRPAGDIDLVVRDEDYERAKALLAGTGLSLHADRGPEPAPGAGSALEIGTGVDLHGYSRWYGVSHPRFFADAERVPVGHTTVLVPRAEDHLRALCLHFLRHDGSRPLRLVDIALLWETRSAGFDTPRMLWGSDRETERVTVTLGLARELLGANLGDTAVAPTLPGWLVPAMERQWGHNLDRPGKFMPELLANPRGIVESFRLRWPQPVAATFNDFPRLPIQWAAFFTLIARYVTLRLSKQARTALGRGR